MSDLSLSNKPSEQEVCFEAHKEETLRHTRELVERHGWNATAYQILNPGMERWFSRAGDAVVGHVTCHGYRVVAGSPVCAPERLEEVVEELEGDTAARGLRTCYFAADERLARCLERRGPLDRILLGAQPVWDPAGWPDILEHKASLRAQLNRGRNKGLVVERWEAERAAGHPELERCLEEWLATRGLPPLHFLVEPETLGRLWDREIFVALLRGVVVGFLVASPIPARQGWLIEQTIRGHDAPNGTSELLVDAAWRHLAERGAAYVTLGLSPLSRRSGFEQVKQHLLLRALLAWVRAHGRRFYNFDGLDAYKAKYMPERWEPIYAITSERRLGLGTLYAIAGAFGRMPPPLLVLRALFRAVRQELRWLRGRR
jgi:phosphatidylglycerol lysyltransferase